MRISDVARCLVCFSLLAACGGAGTPAVQAPANIQETVVRERLEDKLANDPNAALCRRFASELQASEDALIPLFHPGHFVERLLARTEVPDARAAQLRSNPEFFRQYARFLRPPNSGFTCLGTRSLYGEDHIALRVSSVGSRPEYVLFHLSGDENEPFDDYMAVSLGYYHSEINGLSNMSDDGLNTANAVTEMLTLSHQHHFDQIVASYDGLPPEAQANPIPFAHFVNAVFSLRAMQGQHPRFDEVVQRADTLLRDRPYCHAYWMRLAAQVRGDRPRFEQETGRLADLLDDYLLYRE